MKPVQYNMYSDARVDVQPIVTSDGKVQARVIVDNVAEHTFNSKSKVSQSLSLARNPDEMQLATLQLRERMNGGYFFFVTNSENEQILVDYRDGHYDGFIHSLESIDKLMATIGVEENVSSLRRTGLRLNTPVTPVALASRWSVESFHIPGYLQGGAFTSGINFGWSPFMNFVKGIFEITRLICSNGMVGTSDIINSKIPLLNRWEEHLEIASIQMQNKVQGLVSDRLSEMGHINATVSDLQLVTRHIRERHSVTTDSTEAQVLANLAKVTDPMLHLTDYYTTLMLADSNVTARAPGHLSEFTLWNIITEMYSHTNQSEDSTNGGLQRMANKMLFPIQDSIKGKFIDLVPVNSAFADPDQAFFGVAA